MSRPTRADASGCTYLDLQNLARRQGRPTQALLVMYVLERFLARLAAGPPEEQFVLKGGLLLAAWRARRATMDADLLARGLTVDPEQVLATVYTIASARVPSVGVPTRGTTRAGPVNTEAFQLRARSTR